MNSPLIPIIKNQHLARQSHQVVEDYSHLVTNGFAITSEMASLFGDTLYHSYFEQEDWILDIAGNTLYPKESFQNYYTPKELIRIPTSEVANEIAKILQDLDCDSQECCNLLKLALLNKRK